MADPYRTEMAAMGMHPVVVVVVEDGTTLEPPTAATAVTAVWW